MSQPLKVGDRIQVTSNYPFMSRIMEGYADRLDKPVFGTYKGHYGDRHAVELDYEYFMGHDCSGRTKQGHGRWIAARFLKLVTATCSVTGETVNDYATIDGKIFSTKFLESLL